MSIKRNNIRDRKSNGVDTLFWKSTGSNNISCLLCPQSCKLEIDERGKCYIRQNINGQMVLTSYGLTSGIAVDPVEKKPLYHFYPGSQILSFGTAGCNLNCSFCQNWSISKAKDNERLSVRATPQDLVKLCTDNKTPMIAFTYNDPVIFIEYVMDTAQLCHEEKIKTVAVTSGYINKKPAVEFFKHIDAANVDLKSFNNLFYEKYCGAKLKPVLNTLEYIREHTKTWLEITTLIIPGLNDDPGEFKRMADWVKSHLGCDTPWHLSAFYPSYLLNDIPPTPPSSLKNLREMAMERGLRYVYTGNVRDEIGANTYCPECKLKLIDRFGYDVRIHPGFSNSSKCPECNQLISGKY